MTAVETSNVFANLMDDSDVELSSDDEGGTVRKQQVATTPTPTQPPARQGQRQQRGEPSSPPQQIGRETGGSQRRGAGPNRFNERRGDGDETFFRGGRGGRGRGGRFSADGEEGGVTRRGGFGGGYGADWQGGQSGVLEGEAGGRGEGRSFRNERARGGFRDGARGRDFDRHVSGTNRGRGMKKGGGGAHNWGNQQQDFGADDQVAPTAEPSASGTGWDEVFAENGDVANDAGADEEKAKDGEAEEGTEKKEVEPEEVQIDYEDYLRSLNEKRANLPSLRTKEAASTKRAELEKEGFTVHVKPADPDANAAKVSQNKGGNLYYHNQRVRQRDPDDVPLEAEIIHDLGARRDRGGRGGRGRGSFGFGQREKPQSAMSFPRSLDLGDAQAFPSLA